MQQFRFRLRANYLETTKKETRQSKFGSFMTRQDRIIQVTGKPRCQFVHVNVFVIEMSFRRSSLDKFVVMGGWEDGR